MKNKKIVLKEFLKNNFAVSTELGDKLFQKIKLELDQGNQVEIDFKDIVVVITAFLNASIGALYNNLYSDDFLKSHISFINVTESTNKYIDLVIENAKKYFSNEEGFNKNIDDLLNGKN